MEIRLTRDWKRRHKTIKKGTKVIVDNATGRDLIKKKRAKEVNDNIFARLVNKGVDEGTKQTAKFKKKEKEVDGNDREI